MIKVKLIPHMPVEQDVILHMSMEDAKCLKMLANDTYAKVASSRDGYHKLPGEQIKRFQKQLWNDLNDIGVDIP